MGCRKELLYAHFGFDYHQSECPRNCNCGQNLEELPAPLKHEEQNSYHEAMGSYEEPSTEEVSEADAISRGQVEFYYQKILSEVKRQSLKKRDGLSRQVVQVSGEKAGELFKPLTSFCAHHSGYS
jgi:hypothetical protein